MANAAAGSTQNGAFAPTSISGAQAASAASQAAALNRLQMQMQQQQQQQQSPNLAAPASGTNAQTNLPKGVSNQVRELAATITDQQLNQWVEKAKQGKFTAQQRQQVRPPRYLPIANLR